MLPGGENTSYSRWFSVLSVRSTGQGVGAGTGLGGGGSAGSGRQGSVSSETATQDPPNSHTQNPGSQGSVPPLHHQPQASRNLPAQGVLSTDPFTHFIMRSSCEQAPCSQQHRDLPPEAHSLARGETDHGKEIGKCTLPRGGQPLGPGACGCQTFGAEYGVSVTRGETEDEMVGWT